MIQSFLLSVREGLEAALVIGIVLGALQKLNHPELKSAVWRGVVLAAALSIGSALLINILGTEFGDPAEAIFEGCSMLLAAGILTWMIFWMQRQSSSHRRSLENGVQHALASSRKNGVLLVAFLAVAREGLELALFLFAARLTSTPLQTVLGSLLGLAAAVGMGSILFAGTRRLNLRLFFRITNFLLILFAAGLIANGIHEFMNIGLLPGVIPHIWDLNWLLPGTSLLGQLLTALFGYNSAPSLLEAIAYGGYFCIIGACLLAFSLIKPPRVKAVS